MEKKTAAKVLNSVVAATQFGSNRKFPNYTEACYWLEGIPEETVISAMQEYAAQETAGMYSKEQVLSIIGDVKADAVILCDDYEDAQLIKQIDATHYLKPQP